MSLSGRVAAVSSSRAVGGVLQAVSFVILARQTSTAEFGIVMACFAVAAFASVVSDFGISNYALVHWSRGDKEAGLSSIRLVMIPTVFLVTAVSLATSLLITTTVPPIPYLVLACTLVGLGLGLEKLSENYIAFQIADGKMTMAAFSVLARRASALAVFLLFSVIVSPALAFGLSLSLAGLLGLLLCGQDFRQGQRPKRAIVKTTLAQSFPYYLANISAQIRSLDVAVLSALSSTATAGIYAAAQRLINPVYLISSSVISVLLPRAVVGSRSDHRVLLDVLLWTTAVVTLFAVPLSYFSPLAIDVLFGAEYAAAAAPFSVLLWFLGPLMASGPLAAVVQGSGRAREVAQATLFTGPITLVVMAAGALVDGATGMAFAVGGSAAFRCLVFYALGRAAPGTAQ